MIEYQEIWSRPNRQAAEWLLDITERRRHYALKQQEFSCLSVVNGDGLPRAAAPGNPTQRKGMQLADLDSAKNWIITVEIVESILSPKKAAYLQLRREAHGLPGTGERGRPAWVAYVQTGMSIKHGVELSERSMHDWWRELIELTVRVAIRRGSL